MWCPNLAGPKTLGILRDHFTRCVVNEDGRFAVRDDFLYAFAVAVIEVLADYAT